MSRHKYQHVLTQVYHCKLYTHLLLQIQLFSGSHAVFRNNSAKNGGGISVFTPIIYKDTDVSSFYNTLCFIQCGALIADNLSPEEWNVCTLFVSYLSISNFYFIFSCSITLQVSMTFENNTAFHGGAALYVNDISPCSHVSSMEDQTSDDTALPSFNHSLLVLPQFTYR